MGIFGIDEPGWELLVLDGDKASVHPLPQQGTVVVGRSTQADVVIDAQSVSRRHAAFHLQEAHVWVEDLGSANGSRIVTVEADPLRTAQTIDQRLTAGKRVCLTPTASVHLGQVVLRVRRSTADLAVPSVRGGRLELVPGMVVHSASMKHVLGLVERIAQAPLSVLLVGETGVGKDVVARALHAASPRAAGPFVAINCAAIAENLVESELFGHERGAFTGATQTKVGLLEAASGGTAFLDEVGELPLVQQAKLLRTLEAREVLRVGASKPRPIDVRFVAATHRDPASEVTNTLRRDLYFRLSGMTIAIPPLRERDDEIEPLARSFAEKTSALLGQPAPTFEPNTLDALRRYPFPGNVRELRNVIERAVALAHGQPIGVEHLMLDSTVQPAKGIASPPNDERQRILDALERCAGNQTRAAALLGISRRTLVTRLGEYGIARPRASRDR